MVLNHSIIQYFTTQPGLTGLTDNDADRDSKMKGLGHGMMVVREALEGAARGRDKGGVMSCVWSSPGLPPWRRHSQLPVVWMKVGARKRMEERAPMMRKYQV